ncbi:DUF2586 domain-containing protein [Endozoicomonas ascidiicola]|uniref:DUF2586 domain-containing protein n=1 Tax=Endozoicomonas ascidiicola TaxID=1698521 RepID=UPI00082C1369|nr:DUF2586 domain-containing protein [Endozoicomonas ascidiicola]
MSLGSVIVNNQNLMQGSPTEIERLYLFVGVLAAGLADSNLGKVHAIAAQTDLDALLGEDDSTLKTQVNAARENGGQNWFAYALPLADSADQLEAVDSAIAEVSVEGVVMCDPVDQKSDFETMHAKAESMIGKYQRRVHFLACYPAIDSTPSTGQSWSEYASAANAATDGVAADRVCAVAMLYPEFIGALAGRLANKSVTVADSPMRTATGSLIGSYAERPKDKDGQPLTKAVLTQLHNEGRYCVPTWYEDYDGTYTSDGSMLAPVTSDYSVIENLRLADKAARRIYFLLVAKVADRKLNSTPKSEAQHITYFGKPLREMSHSTTVGGITFPGEIKTPQAGDIVISWPTRTKVQVYFKLRPYEIAKELEGNILLDLSTPADQA